MNPPVGIILTTYNRRDVAEITVRSLINNLHYDNLKWCLVDDGSSPSYIQELAGIVSASGGSPFIYDSARRGVGHGMNFAMRHYFSIGTDYILMMEDDWELHTPLELEPYVKALQNPEYGMIRFGYISAGVLGYMVSESGKLYWRLDNNGETYRFTGHPSLRHKRFHDKDMGGCGFYDEGLTAGMTELSMCGKSNKYNPPTILYPAECGAYGFFHHIGSVPMGDIQPER